MKGQKTFPSLGELVSLFVHGSFEAVIGDDEAKSRFLWGIRLNGEADVGLLGNLHNSCDAQSQAPAGSDNHSSVPLSTSDESMEERSRKLFLPYE